MLFDRYFLLHRNDHQSLSLIFVFKLKTICVPLLEHSLLTPTQTPRVLSLLSRLNEMLQEFHLSGYTLESSMVSYAMFPLTSMLRRNRPSAIPDQVMERLFDALCLLCESWWWDCDIRAWEQIFMLCGAVIGGIESKEKIRADETKEAAVRCLVALTRDRGDTEDLTLSSTHRSPARDILTRLKNHAESSHFIPILGQTINSLIITAGSSHTNLQKQSLRALHILIAHYSTVGFVPSILPGVVSAMTRISLGISSSKGWANGDIVVEALAVMQEVIIRSIGDDICLREGAVRGITELDNLADLLSDTSEAQVDSKPFSVHRTSTWLRATSSQLLMALKTLTPLISHPTPVALRAFSVFSISILAATPLSMPQTQPLLLSFLLSLSQSQLPSVSTYTRQSLSQLFLQPSEIRHSLLQTLLQTTRDNLATLPRLVSSHSDAKVEHVAGQIEAACLLAITDTTKSLALVSSGLGKLLGPMGGIEKWGWRLLSVLEFDAPAVTVTGTSSAQLLLENDPGGSASMVFPEITLKHIATRSTQDALERMLRALGQAAGDECLYSVEWFLSLGRSRGDSKGAASLWCACRLLEGVSGICLSTSDVGDGVQRIQDRRVRQVVRGIARSISDLWDVDDFLGLSTELPEDSQDEVAVTEHIKGLIVLDPSLQVGTAGAPSLSASAGRSTSQPQLHKALSLHLLSLAAGIMEARFAPMLLYTLYPVLHSIVSLDLHLSTTGLAALSFISSSMSFASPANLLLSNFDYALDAVSRRLTRQRLDLDATKVLAVLVRLVGRDVVQKAGDVVEECFDRLDEYHGYSVIVEGLVDVLGEVVRVIEEDDETHVTREEDLVSSSVSPPDSGRLESFVLWYTHRHDSQNVEEDKTDYGPAPRMDWGAGKEAEKEDADTKTTDPNAEPPATPTQSLTKQIVSRSMYFITHGSPLIRARILTLLSSSVPVLPESALLPSIHQAWPFILNRLADTETFVVSAAAMLVESLSTHVGSFMFQRIWDDVWPRFKLLLGKLDEADSKSALTRRGAASSGTESAYTHSHRLYRAILRTMTATVKNVQMKDAATWEMLLAFRRFLHRHAHEELQSCAKEFYIAIAEKNEDAVWLALCSTMGAAGGSLAFLTEEKWDIKGNVMHILPSDAFDGDVA